MLENATKYMPRTFLGINYVVLKQKTRVGHTTPSMTPLTTAFMKNHATMMASEIPKWNGPVWFIPILPCTHPTTKDFPLENGEAAFVDGAKTIMEHVYD